MLTIRGTRHGDDLFAPDSGARIRGGLGDDSIEGRMGNDILYGDGGNDALQDVTGGFNRLYGGRGDDVIFNINGEAWGGVGNDDVSALGLAVGGSGDDRVSGSGQLFGDEGPGVTPSAVGNDTLHTSTGATPTQMTGGLGADQFSVGANIDGVYGIVEIMDFTAGQDKIGVGEWHGGGDADPGNPYQTTFDRLDANHNGVIEFTDSAGADGDWYTPDGGAVYFDGRNLILGLGATFATGFATDAEDWLVVHGTTQLTRDDFLFG